MSADSNEKVLFKCGQKYSDNGQNAAETTLTNLYLTEV